MADSLGRKSNIEFDHNTSWQYADVGKHYEANRFQSLTGRRFHEAEVRAIQQLLDTAESTGEIHTAIDLPCGTGRISQVFAGRGYGLTCADISMPMLKTARETMSKLGNNASYSAADIYNTPFDDNTFDCVSCIRLFQHLDNNDCIRALKELARISSRYVIVNFMYASGYYKAMRRLRKVTGRYAPRYTISKGFLSASQQETGLILQQKIFPQPLHSGNIVVLFEIRKG